MSDFDQWLSASLNTVALPVWMAGALAALLVFAGVLAFRRAAQLGIKGLGWRVALIAVGAGLAWILVGSTGGSDKSAAIRTLEARANDLTLRTLVPGSPLACLDMVGNETVEIACEKTLFASSQTIAAAASYVDARLSLLADSLDLAARDRNYEASIERTRRALEEDRFGFVAHVLANRGCTAENCPTFKLLRNSKQVLTNLRERSFDANVILHASAWSAPAPAAPSAPAAPALASVPPATTTGAAPPLPPGKYDFPSSASIPAISIMNAEPALPPSDAGSSPQQNAAPSAPARPAARRQSARETQQPVQPAPQAAPLPPPGTTPLPPPGTIANPR